ncbi:MAG: hypothetical protein NXH97_15300 [Rhodobacteraceae bacterium]|nr:hypothetical protein [Paracoccaceae bacterium]
MSNTYDWDRVAHRLREHLSSEGMPRVGFAGRARITVIDLDRLLTGMPVAGAVLASIEANTDLSFADLSLEPAAEPARFEVPKVAPSDLLLGAFTMYRWSFDYPDRIVRSRVEFFDCAQTGRRRFASQQSNRAPGGQAYAYDHAGFVWPGSRIGISQLVSEDEGILRVITLARPVCHDDHGGCGHVTVNGTLQTVSEQGDVGHYPAISPVFLETRSEEAANQEPLGSYRASDPEMVQTRPPLGQSIADRLLALGPRVLPALGTPPRTAVRGPRSVTPLAG